MLKQVASLAIVGSYPPPYGGVGAHVQRLCPLLEQRGIDYVVYNATSEVGDGRRVVPVFKRRGLWLLRYLLTAQEPAIYLMSGRLSAWVIGALMVSWRGKRVLLRLRNASLPDWIADSRWRRMWAEFALRRMTGVVCVSRLLVGVAGALGVEPDKLHWCPGFLPPASDEVEPSRIAPECRAFMSGHRPLIAANGRVDWYRGQDMYGLDHLVELAARLKRDYPRVGVVTCFSDHGPRDQSYVDRLLEAARANGVENNVLFHTRSGPFVPVLAAADIFVRPSNTDGDAISVREGLYLGVPTVASDAVERPEGAVLFRTRDLDDFEAKVRSVLASLPTRASPGPVELAAADRLRIERYLELLATVAGATR